MSVVMFSVMMLALLNTVIESQQDHPTPHLISLQLLDSDLDDVFRMALQENFLNNLLNGETHFKNNQLKELMVKCRQELIAKYNSLSQEGKEFVDKKLQRLKELHDISLKGHLLDYEHLVQKEKTILKTTPRSVVMELERKIPLIIRLFTEERFHFILHKIALEQKNEL